MVNTTQPRSHPGCALSFKGKAYGDESIGNKNRSLIVEKCHHEGDLIPPMASLTIVIKNNTSIFQFGDVAQRGRILAVEGIRINIHSVSVINANVLHE